jgi:hypothetical protein
VIEVHGLTRRIRKSLRNRFLWNHLDKPSKRSMLLDFGLKSHL